MSMDTAPAPAPAPPRRPERTGLALAFGVGIGVALAIGLALILAIGLLGAVVVLRASDSLDTDVVDVGFVATEPADAPAVVARFVTDWTSADWVAMGEYADETVVETARSSHVDGLVVEIVGPVTDSGGELLVLDPAGGHASVFIFTLGADSDLLVSLDGLTFAGDAG